MDMKRILQALDQASTKPVEGAKDMSKFLNIVDQAAKPVLLEGSPHKVSLPVQMAMQHYQTPTVRLESKSNIPTSIKRYFKEVESDIEEHRANRRQVLYQYASTIAERVLMKESKQNAVDVSAKRAAIKDLLDKDIYAKVDDKDFKDYDKKHHKSRYLQKENLDEHEIPDHSMGFTGGVGPGVQSNEPVEETPIQHNIDQPHNPRVYAHEKFNSHELMTLISMARHDLNRIAEMANKIEHMDDESKLVVWKQVAQEFQRNGLIGTLADRVEQIRHGIDELAKARHTGKGVSPQVRSQLSPNLGEISVQEANDLKRKIKSKV